MAGCWNILRKGIVAIGLAIASHALLAQPLVLNTGNRDPYATDSRDGFLDLLAAEAFRRAGASAQIQSYESSERALLNANNGIDDGVALRIRGLESLYPNLIMVPEKIIDNDFVACATNPELTVPGWKALTPHQVVHLIGWKVFELNVPAETRSTKVKDAQQMFVLLGQGRADLALYERWQALWWARKMGLKIKVLEPPLARQEMFFYLHRKHAGLVDKVASALAEMKKDGTYRRIFDTSLTPLAVSR
jgi:polar amino acid transport system substrate-binding protein